MEASQRLMTRKMKLALFIVAQLGDSNVFASTPIKSGNIPWPPISRNTAEGDIDMQSLSELKRPWWDLGLADDILNEVGLYYLGQAWYQATDVGEMLETFSRCNASDPWSWTLEFCKTAERLEDLAKESADAGKKLMITMYQMMCASVY